MSGSISLLEVILRTTNTTISAIGSTSLYMSGNCTHASITDFPAANVFTREELLSGFVALYFLGAAYGFLVVALICENYFLPSVCCICEALNMSPDVAGATFMAFATSAPELSTSVIGVFVTESDIGVGTVMGSAVFNILGIAACTGLAAKQTIKLDKWPLTRDTTIYIVAVVALVVIIWDEKVTWIESTVMMFLIVIYVCIMVYNQNLKNLSQKVQKICTCKCCQKDVSGQGDFAFKCAEHAVEVTDSGQGVYRPFFIKVVQLNQSTTPRPSAQPSVPAPLSVIDRQGSDITDTFLMDPDEEMYSLLRPPAGSHWYGKLYWLLSWPPSLLLALTIPNCKRPKFRKLYPVTFIMCVVWIAMTSYFVSWMITVIGDTFHIIDSVMGLTFLAAGGCLPEAISSIIMARRGEGSMGISNSLGANTLDVLLCLGLPWLLKSAVSNGAPVHIQSGGVRYSLLAMLALAVVYRWGLVTVFRHRASKLFGGTCLFLYVAYLSISIAIELNAFGYVNGPVCEWI